MTTADDRALRDAAQRALVPPDHADASSDEIINRILRAVRSHLGVDVAFVGEVLEDRRVFRYVDAAPGVQAVRVGDADPLDQAYCSYVLDGRLPNFIHDPADHPVAAGLPVTRALPVGSHLSVPIRFSDGRVYGTFCAFALDVTDNVADRDVPALKMMAELAGEYLEAIDAAQRGHKERRAEIQSVLDDPEGMEMVFQPLWHLTDMSLGGVEALARFPRLGRPPDQVFAQADEVGLGVDLEMRAVRQAFEAFEVVPEWVRLNVNVSPRTLYTDVFFDAIAEVAADRVVVEVTEHAAVDDYGQLKAASARLTGLGAWLAIDDVGMGFSGLNRILESSPEELKLDAAVIRDVHRNPVKQALIEAFCSFGERAGYSIVAEGIESAEELAVVRDLGARIGQGFHLGRPGPLEAALEAARTR